MSSYWVIRIRKVGQISVYFKTILNLYKKQLQVPYKELFSWTIWEWAANKMPYHFQYFGVYFL